MDSLGSSHFSSSKRHAVLVKHCTPLSLLLAGMPTTAPWCRYLYHTQGCHPTARYEVYWLRRHTPAISVCGESSWGWAPGSLSPVPPLPIPILLKRHPSCTTQVKEGKPHDRVPDCQQRAEMLGTSVTLKRRPGSIGAAVGMKWIMSLPCRRGVLPKCHPCGSPARNTRLLIPRPPYSIRQLCVLCSLLRSCVIMEHWWGGA
jgi:hypothetical protein